jgi:DNA mismatch repair protein MSH5
VPYQIDIRPSQEFNSQAAKNKLIALEIFARDDGPLQFLVPCNGISDNDRVDPENVGFTAQKGKLLRLAGFIDMENTVTLGCAGAILTYLQRKRTDQYLPGDESVHAFRVRSVEMFSLQGTM